MSKQNQKNHNKKDQKKKKGRGFTLVELIVVITILAILGTIAFISLQNYTKNSRDSQRIADINSIEKSLGTYMAEKGSYPDPDLGTNITYSGGLAWTQGTVGDTMITNLKNINKKPTDPLTFNEYTYSVTSYKDEYQIGAILEIGLVSNISVVEKANAATIGSKKAMAMVKGNYNQVMLKVSTGSVDYILAVPSIINADLSDLDLLSIINKKQLVYNNRENLPDSYKGAGYSMTGGFDYVPTGNKVEIYKGSLGLLNGDKGLKKEMIETLKQAYNGSIIGSDFPYADVIKIDTSDIKKLELLANNYLKNGLIVDVSIENDISFVRSIGNLLKGMKGDYNGNTYLGGNFYNNIILGSISVITAGSDDGYLVKYDIAGEPVWGKNIGGTSYDELNDLALDSPGNIYVGGSFNSSMNIGLGAITSSGSNDGYVAKYNTGGTPLWIKKIGGTSSDNVYSVISDGSSIYAGGSFNGTINIGLGALVSSGSTEGFVAKYDTSGTPIWIKKIGGTSSDNVNSLTPDGSTNIYAGGSFNGTINIGLGPVVSSGSTEGFVAKYNSSGTPLWIKKIGGTSSDNVYSIVVDSAGNVYAGGSFNGTINIGLGAVVSSGSTEGFVAKYDSSGTPLWIKKIGGTSSDNVYSVNVDSSGNIYVGGSFYATMNLGLGAITSLGSSDGFVAKYDSNGNILSLTKAGGSSLDNISKVFVDYNGNVYAGGYFYDFITVGITDLYAYTFGYGYGYGRAGFGAKYKSDLSVY